MFASLQTVGVAGEVLRVAEDGDAASSRTLVLVHAFPVGTGVFEPQRGAFGAWRVIVPALPGFDGSDLPEPATIDAFAARILALLDAMTVERAVVAGVSLGGYVAFGMLRLDPRRVAGLVLADTRATADSEDARAARRRMLATIEAGRPAAVADAMVPTLLGPTTRARRPEVASAVRAMIERQSREGLAAAVEAIMSRPDSTPLLPDLAVPALVVVGEEDPVTPPDEMERMAAGIRGSQFVRIPGAGHLSNLEAPGAFNRAVASFLQGLG